MSATTGRGITYPTTGDVLTPLETIFATLATTSDTAIGTAFGPAAYFKGTNATRLALGAGTVPVLAEGIYWYTTDTNLLWFYNGAAWVSNGGRPVAEFTFAAQAFTNATEQILGGAGKVYVEVSDPEGWHDMSTNPTRFTPNIPGVYDINFPWSWAFNGTGTRYVKILVNGSAVAGGADHATTTTFVAEGSLSMKQYFNGTTDYFELAGWQNSGGNLNLTARLTVNYLGPRH